MNFIRLKTVLLCFIFSFTSIANAGLIIADFTTTLVAVSGANLNGLDGASITIHAEFDDTSTYVDFFGQPTIAALSHTITISSATVASSNGTFFNNNGLMYIPTHFNSFLGTDGNFLNVNGVSIRMRTAAGSIVPTIGDVISIDHFNTTNFLYGSDDVENYYSDDNGALYDWTQNNLTITSTQIPVPEPLTLSLFTISILGLTFRKLNKR